MKIFGENQLFLDFQKNCQTAEIERYMTSFPSNFTSMPYFSVLLACERTQIEIQNF